MELHHVEKEEVKFFSFGPKDVLKEPELIKKRNADLARALAMGNLEHIKVHIIFQTGDGVEHEVFTTVWAVTQTEIVLKQHTTIPIHAIVRLTF